MCGYDHESFWDQTPRTLSLTFEAYRIAQINAHNERAWLAFTVAAFSRTKRLDSKSLRRVMMKDKAPVTSMDKQIEGLRQWVIATGGKVINADQSRDH